MIRGLQPGISTMEGWGLNMFTDDELTEIHLATLDVLQNYGVGVHCEEAMDIFENGGAYVDRENNHVRIPAHLVEDAISSAPSTILLAGRTPEYDVTLQGGRVGFTSFGAGVMVVQRAPLMGAPAMAATARNLSLMLHAAVYDMEPP